MVAVKNFCCGSSREHVTHGIKHAWVVAVIVGRGVRFARILKKHLQHGTVPSSNAPKRPPLLGLTMSGSGTGSRTITNSFSIADISCPTCFSFYAVASGNWRIDPLRSIETVSGKLRDR